MHSRNDSGEKKKGHPRMQYIDNIKKWARASLEENIRVAHDRTLEQHGVKEVGAANVRTDDADYSKVRCT